MICPRCKKPKTRDDFYYKKGTGFKNNAECKTCIGEIKKEQRTDTTQNGIFNLKKFAKAYRF